MNDKRVSRVPWSLQPSLKSMLDEVGMDFDSFVESIKNEKTDYEIAQEFGVTEKTVKDLREHFEKFGLHSIVGQD